MPQTQHTPQPTPAPASAQTQTSASASAPTPARTPAPAPAPTPGTPYYRRSGAISLRFNRLVGRLARHGVSLLGTAEMSVRGRKSGTMQRVPVNQHVHEGTRYLVSARGHSQWVRNMRAAGGGELRVGRKVKTFTATEIADAEKPAVLRAYLEKWGWEVNQYFRGVTAASSDDELLAAAPDHPVFRITLTG